jgi:arginine decarboxylase
MVNCVLAQAFSDQEGDFITAVIAVAMAKSLGCVVEHSAVNKDPGEVKLEAEAMVRHMMEVRGLKIKEIVIEMVTHEVVNMGSAVAALIYLSH